MKSDKPDPAELYIQCTKSSSRGCQNSLLETKTVKNSALANLMILILQAIKSVPFCVLLLTLGFKYVFMSSHPGIVATAIELAHLQALL